MDEKEYIVGKIQELRKEINDIIVNQIKPKREELDKLLNMQAELICPFQINDIVTLPNKKKGVITKIKYHSLDYQCSENKEDVFDFFPFDKVDELEYQFAYQVDDCKFSITWMISGLRLIQNDTKTGKIPFVDISPILHIIDKENKTIMDKPLSGFMNIDDMTGFDSIK